MEWIDTNLLISICTCVIGIIQFLFWKHIAKQKSYESEKGRNLATKEDIKEITEKVEQVKENYNKSLESHKAELQKSLDSHRYIIGMCHELDNKLIRLMTECINIKNSQDVNISNNDMELKSKVIELDEFLNMYNVRYKERLGNLINTTQYTKYIFRASEPFGYSDECTDRVLDQGTKNKLMEEIHKSLSLFLPKL